MEKEESFNILMKIINLVYDYKTIKLIICPSLNGNLIKKNLLLYYENKLEFDNISIYYNQEFMSKEELSKYILLNENDNEDIANLYEELDSSPNHFYEIKNINSIQRYKEYLQNNIKEYIKEYKDSTIKSSLDILNLLDLVIGEKIISSTSLLEKLQSLPLKYLKITKFKTKYKDIINLDTIFFKELKRYLLLLFNEKNKKNDLFFKENFEIEEMKNLHFFDIYQELVNRKRNLFGNYYKYFIQNKKYDNDDSSKIHIVDNIFVYKLDFNSLLFEKEKCIMKYSKGEKVYMLYFMKFCLKIYFIGGFFEIIFNGNYYNMALLIKTDQYNHFYLVIFQIIYKKDSDKRFIN